MTPSKQRNGDFPGGPVVKAQCCHCCGQGSIPGPRVKIPQVVQHSQLKKKQKHRGMCRWVKDPFWKVPQAHGEPANILLVENLSKESE